MAIIEASTYLLYFPSLSSISLVLFAVVVLVSLWISSEHCQGLLTILNTSGYYGALSIYNIWLHPLAKYPGPRLAAASPLWMILSYFHGRTPTDLLKLHNKYGPVVRTGPNDLSFISPMQWREIYGYKSRGEVEFARDPRYFSGLGNDPIIFTADTNYHGYIRKLLGHGFSERSLREQEPILKEYINTLFHRLDKECQNGEQPLDIASWFNVGYSPRHNQGIPVY